LGTFFVYRVWEKKTPLPQMAFLVVEDLIGFDNLRGELFVISKNKETLKEILSGLKSRREDPLNEERSEEKTPFFFYPRRIPQSR
jgi:anthranilate/para-aminobenzoate synthase component I